MLASQGSPTKGVRLDLSWDMRFRAEAPEYCHTISIDNEPSCTIGGQWS